MLLRLLVAQRVLSFSARALCDFVFHRRIGLVGYQAVAVPAITI